MINCLNWIGKWQPDIINRNTFAAYISASPLIVGISTMLGIPLLDLKIIILPSKCKINWKNAITCKDSQTEKICGHAAFQIELAGFAYVRCEHLVNSTASSAMAHNSSETYGAPVLKSIPCKPAKSFTIAQLPDVKWNFNPHPYHTHIHTHTFL